MYFVKQVFNTNLTVAEPDAKREGVKRHVLYFCILVLFEISALYGCFPELPPLISENFIERCSELNEDEDRDGMVDEGLDCCEAPATTRPCGLGICMSTQRCGLDFQWEYCLGLSEAYVEECDALDNDCDGRVDEEDVCTPHEQNCNLIDDDEDGIVDEPFIACEQNRYSAGLLMGQELDFNALQSTLANPYGVAVGEDGTVYFTAGHAVYTLTLDGEVIRIAGTGEAGNSVHYGSALLAQLNEPRGIDVAANGNVYVADSQNHMIRIIQPNGEIYRAAGTGSPGSAMQYPEDEPLIANVTPISTPEDVVVDNEGGFYFTDYGNNQVLAVDQYLNLRRVAGNGSLEQREDEMPLNTPRGLSLDVEGNLYIVESGAVGEPESPDRRRLNRIWKVGREGETTIFDVHGLSASAILFDVEVGESGKLFAVDYGASRIYELAPEMGEDGNRVLMATRLAGVDRGFSGDDGPSIDAQMNLPTRLAFDVPRRQLIVADNGNHRLRKVDLEPNDPLISSVVGSGESDSNGDGTPALNVALNGEYGVVLDSEGNIYFAETNDHVIRKVDVHGIISTFAGTGEAGSNGDGGPAVLAQLNLPVGLAIDASDNLYIVDRNNHKIRKVDSSPEHIISTVAGTGVAGFSELDGQGNHLQATAAQLNIPYDVTVDDEGNLFIADTSNHRVRRVDAETGFIETIAGTGVNGVVEESKEGLSIALESMLSFPSVVFIDSHTNILYVSDNSERNIRKINLNLGVPTIETIAGDGRGGFGRDGQPAVGERVSDVRDLFVDSLGNLLFSQGAGQRISKIDPEGFVYRLIGLGESNEGVQFTFGGDGGLAEFAKLNLPYGLFVYGGDEQNRGEIFFADSQNRCIRKVEEKEINGAMHSIISTVAGEIYPEGTDVVERGKILGAKALRENPISDGVMTVSYFSNRLFSVSQERGQVEVLAGYINGFEDGTYPDELDLQEWNRDDLDDDVERQRYVPAKYARQFFSPFDLAFDNTGEPVIYVTEEFSIRKIILPSIQNPDTWGIRTLVGQAERDSGYEDAAYSLAQFNGLRGIVLSTAPQTGKKYLYVADQRNSKIRFVDLEEKRVGTVDLRNADGNDIGLSDPEHLEMDAQGRLWITDIGNPALVEKVFVVNLDDNRVSGEMTRVFGTRVFGDDPDIVSSFESGMRAEELVVVPRGIAVKENGDVYVSTRTQIIRIEAGENGIAEPSDFVELVYQADRDNPIPDSVDSLARQTPQLLGDLHFENGVLRVYEEYRGRIMTLER